MEAVARRLRRQPWVSKGVDSSGTLLNTGPFRRARFAEAYTGATAIILDELNARSFQRSAQGGFIGERYRHFPIDDLCSADSCHADF